MHFMPDWDAVDEAWERHICEVEQAAERRKDEELEAAWKAHEQEKE